MKFYLVRSPRCYHKHAEEIKGCQNKLDTLEEAQQVAKDLATQTRSTQYVYEVTLVGKAHLNEAVWTPESDNAA